MHDQIPLLTTLVMAFLVAFALGFVASQFKISPIVGYLAAGIAIGPHTPGFVADRAIASQLAEIGVILLMFGVGLQFSLRELLIVRWIAVTGAIVQTAVVTAVGMGLAAWFGWSAGAGAVLGLSLSVASTIVMLRVFEEMKALRTLHGRIAVGWLLSEDLLMVLTLVLLPALAVVGEPGIGVRLNAERLGEALVLTLGKFGLLAGVMLVVGRRVVPWFLAKVARIGSRELFTLAVLAAALGVAYASAELFSVSFALGAFLAGIVLSESDVSHQAAANSLPFRDAFAVLFFVSIGMLFDPSILVREPVHLFAILVTVMALRPAIAFALVVAFRYPIATALFVAGSRAQVGEFSFIVAAMGVYLGLLPPDGQTLILGGALLSIAANPLLLRAIPAVERRLNGVPLTGRIVHWLNRSGVRPDLEADGGPKDHAIVVGYGRVGGLIGDSFRQNGIAYVVVEEDRRLVDRLRAEGLAVIFGNAVSPGILEAAVVARARLIVAAVPNGFIAGQIIARAREANPGIETVARAHDDGEVSYLKRMGARVVLMGERELALGMAMHALVRMDATEEEARATVQRLKAQEQGDG